MIDCDSEVAAHEFNEYSGEIPVGPCLKRVRGFMGCNQETAERKKF